VTLVSPPGRCVLVPQIIVQQTREGVPVEDVELETDITKERLAEGNATAEMMEEGAR